MDSESLELFAEATRALVADAHKPVGWSLLREFGWLDLMAERPQTAAPLLLEELGRRGRASAAVDVCVSAAVRAAGADLPDAPASYVFAGACASERIVNGQVPVTGVLLWQEPGEELWILVPVVDGIERALAVARLAPGTSVSMPAGVDARSHAVVVTTGPAEVVHLLDGGSADRAEQAARRAVGHELVGLTAGMLAIAVEHATARMQFGRTIGSFQAVKHMLADVVVAMEAARGALDECWQGPAEAELVSLVATVLCGRAAELAIRNCLQVTGGMGFTEEFPLGALVRRALMIEPLFGGERASTSQVGRTLFSAKQVPRLSDFKES